jgi:hypothetical protein
VPTPSIISIASLRKFKKELARSRAGLLAALQVYGEPDVSEFLNSAAGLKDRRLIVKLIERQRNLLNRLKVEEKILL